MSAYGFNKAFDPACLVLATHFLADEPAFMRESADELAMFVQQAVEDWTEMMRANHAEEAPPTT